MIHTYFFPNDNMFQGFFAVQFQVFDEKMLPKPCQARANSTVGMLKMLVFVQVLPGLGSNGTFQ